MTKTIHASRIGFLSVGISLALVLLVTSAAMPTAHAALMLDSTTTGMLTTTLSATQTLMTTVQTHINAGAFTPSQSVVLSSTLGSIGSILANISSMIGGVSFPNTGYPSLDMQN